MLARPIAVLGQSCTSARMKPKQYFTLVKFDVSFCIEIVVSFILTINAADPWWVNSTVRNPVVIPYTHGQGMCVIFTITAATSGGHAIWLSIPKTRSTATC